MSMFGFGQLLGGVGGVLGGLLGSSGRRKQMEDMMELVRVRENAAQAMEAQRRNQVMGSLQSDLSTVGQFDADYERTLQENAARGLAGLNRQTRAGLAGLGANTFMGNQVRNNRITSDRALNEGILGNRMNTLNTRLGLGSEGRGYLFNLGTSELARQTGTTPQYLSLMAQRPNGGETFGNILGGLGGMASAGSFDKLFKSARGLFG